MMLIKRIIVSALFFGISFTYAETIRTDVLVVGGSASGVAAAIQCARSKVKTMLVEQGPWLGGNMTAGGMCVLEANRDLPSGIWGEFRKRIKDFYKKTPRYDTTYNAILRFEPYTGAAILKKMTDTVKNLTVKVNTPFTSIKKDGTGWEIKITANGKTDFIKAKVVIDATETADVATKAGAKFTNDDNRQKNVSWIAILKDFGRDANKTIAKPANYDPTLYACLKGKNIRKMLDDGRLPNDKYMINWSECGNQYHANTMELNAKNTDGLYQQARLYTLGLVFYLQTELGLKNLGPDEEFNTPDHLPYTPYIEKYNAVNGIVRMASDDIYAPYGRESKLYRTSIAVVDAIPYQDDNIQSQHSPFPAYTIPVGAVVVNNLENLLVTENALSVTPEVWASTAYPSVQMTLGQGAGTVAAYCAFFKTTTKNLKVRVIQGELLDFKGYLLPFSDLPLSDPNFRAIQQVCATGLLKGIPQQRGNMIKIQFRPDSTVKASEIKPVLFETYSRAFIWFNKEKPGEIFTVGNLLSLISDFTLTDPKTLQTTLQKAWKAQYKFTSEFDLNRPVTRREFATLANKFLNPFARTVDLSGNLVN